jgi:hypothetical protein
MRRFIISTLAAVSLIGAAATVANAQTHRGGFMQFGSHQSGSGQGNRRGNNGGLLRIIIQQLLQAQQNN